MHAGDVCLVTTERDGYSAPRDCQRHATLSGFIAMSVHTIRLAGPWERHTAGAELVRITLPNQFSEDAPPCHLIRRFHRPSGLTDECEVSIVFTVDTASLEVTLNDQPVPVSGTRRCSTGLEVTCNVTPLLEPFNSLGIRGAGNCPLTVQSAVLRIHEKCR